jgi:hypothetical protein
MSAIKEVENRVLGILTDCPVIESKSEGFDNSVKIYSSGNIVNYLEKEYNNNKIQNGLINLKTSKEYKDKIKYIRVFNYFFNETFVYYYNSEIVSESEVVERKKEMEKKSKKENKDKIKKRKEVKINQYKKQKKRKNKNV